MTPDGKDWVDVLEALLTPTIALSALGLGVLNYFLALKRRRDDLFDRRYSHFTVLWRLYVERNGADLVRAGEHAYADGFNWNYHAIQAGFVFGPDIEAHVRSFNRGPKVQRPVDVERWRHVAPSEWFALPFRRYLELKR